MGALNSGWKNNTRTTHQFSSFVSIYKVHVFCSVALICMLWLILDIYNTHTQIILLVTLPSF